MVLVPTIPNNIKTDEKIVADKVAFWEDVFLEKLAEECNVTAACTAANISRSTAYDHKNTNPRFAQLWADSIASAGDQLRSAAYQLAKGKFPIYNEKGEITGYLNPNPVVLLRLLQAHDPAYRDVSRAELTGKDGDPIKTQNVTLEGLTETDIKGIIDEYVQRKISSGG